jgi:hypothetical protein
MLHPHQIFARMPRETARGILQYLHEHQKPFYKASVDSLAQSRKMRPVFIERKPRAEQYAWLAEQLGREIQDPIAAHVLQVWLVGAHKNMLCDFLDGFGIAHDENGTVDNVPPAPAKTDVERVVSELSAKYDPTVFAIYLHAFQALDPVGWPTLAEVLQENPALHLKESASAQ